MNQTRCIVILSILALFVASICCRKYPLYRMLLKRFLKENHVLTLPGRLAIILPVLSSFIFLLPVSGRWNGVRRNFRKD